MNFKKIVIIGGGVLGTQIALISAYTGHDTTLWMRSEGTSGRTKPRLARYQEEILKALSGAKTLIGNPMSTFLYPKGLIRSWDGITEEKIDVLTQQAKERFEQLIHLELDLSKALAGADIVIEAMSEDPKAKIAVYEKMRDLMDEKTILCTNSSTLLPSALAAYTGRPDRYCALHFANEIWKNNTAEIMGHPGTDPKVYEKVVEFAAEMNMVPLQLHKEQPGYILNSMLVPFLSSAQALWANGVADPETIDLTWRLATGAPKGPFQILDIVGLETAYNINQMKPDAQKEGTTLYKIGQRLKEKIDRGETGINAGKGFYTY